MPPGCFHGHTEWSDGRTSVQELAEAARARRWRYLGISDHSLAASYAGGLSPDELRLQGEEIDAWNEQHGAQLWIFKAIRSGFRSAANAMTQRVLRALEDPRLTFLEINSNPRRMELDWRHWRTARAAGVLAAVNPDAHSPQELGYVRFGVNVARKGWLGPADVVNAWQLDDVRRLLASRKQVA